MVGNKNGNKRKKMKLRMKKHRRKEKKERKYCFFQAENMIKQMFLPDALRQIQCSPKVVLQGPFSVHFYIFCCVPFSPYCQAWCEIAFIVLFKMTADQKI